MIFNLVQWAILGLLFFVFLFVILWAHERNLRTKLQKHDQPHNVNQFFELRQQHNECINALETKMQELRGIMLEYAASNAILKLQLTKNNRALYRKNRALKNLRYRPIPKAIFRPVEEGVKKGEELQVFAAAEKEPGQMLYERQSSAFNVASKRIPWSALSDFGHKHWAHQEALLDEDKKELDEVTLAAAQNDSQ